MPVGELELSSPSRPRFTPRSRTEADAAVSGNGTDAESLAMICPDPDEPDPVAPDPVADPDPPDPDPAD